MKLKSILILLSVFVSIVAAPVGWAGWKQQSAAACELADSQHFHWDGGAVGPGYLFCPVEETDSFRVNSVTSIKLDVTSDMNSEGISSDGGFIWARVCTELAGGSGNACSTWGFFRSSGTDWKVLSGSDLNQWSDPHFTNGFRFFELLVGHSKFHGYLIEHK